MQTSKAWARRIAPALFILSLLTYGEVTAQFKLLCDGVSAVGGTSSAPNFNLLAAGGQPHPIEPASSSGVVLNPGLIPCMQAAGIQPPAPPSNLKIIQAKDNFIDLAWSDNSNNEDGFKIERSTDRGDRWNLLATVDSNKTTYRDSLLSEVTEYCYRVFAFNQSGNSPYSNDTCATTVPNRPTNLTATNFGDTLIVLTWKDNSDVEDYFGIERRTASDTVMFYDTVPDDTTFFFDTNIEEGTTYTYVVRACQFPTPPEGRCSPGSNPGSATTALAQPSDCVAKALSHNSILVTWSDNSSKEAGYRIERRLATEEDFTQVGEVGLDVKSFKDTGLQPNTTYDYVVWAFNQDNRSEFSNIAFDTTFLPVTWDVSLIVLDKSGLFEELALGLAPTGTDGIDAGHGEETLSPPPPSGIFDARLALPVTPPVHSHKDFRSDTQTAADWIILFQPGPLGLSIEFSWDKTRLPAKGTFHLKDRITGTLVNRDMKQENRHTLTTSGINSLAIEYRTEMCKNIAVLADWNLISVPVVAVNMEKSNLFPTAISNASAYENGYVTAPILKSGRGYWLRFGASENVPICGTAVEADTVGVAAGWNIIGVYENDVPVSQITLTPADLVRSNFFGYNAGYQIATRLESGKGYWVHVSKKGRLNLTQSGTEQMIASAPANEEINNNWREIILTDRIGRASNLYLTDQEIDLNRYALPPLPPAGMFDVRYSSDRYMERLGVEGKEIRISSASYPIRLRAEGMDILVRDLFSENILNETFTSGEELIISNSAVTAIKLAPAQSPLTYKLHQNYPNPILSGAKSRAAVNPTTTIKFSLPVAGRVRLTLYNLLGEKVTELIDKELEAGAHQVEMNTKDYAAGIYFYRMESGSFTDLKKLVILE